MANLLTALVLILVGGSASELVRTTCRRRLLTPLPQRAQPEEPLA